MELLSDFRQTVCGCFKALDLFQGSLPRFPDGQHPLPHGVKELLEKLVADGFALGVATSKYEPYAVKVLKELGVLEYFGFVFGSIGDRNEKPTFCGLPSRAKIWT